MVTISVYEIYFHVLQTDRSTQSVLHTRLVLSLYCSKRLTPANFLPALICQPCDIHMATPNYFRSAFTSLWRPQVTFALALHSVWQPQSTSALALHLVTLRMSLHMSNDANQSRVFRPHLWPEVTSQRWPVIGLKNAGLFMG